MIIEFSGGKIIATPYELTVRITGINNTTLHAQTDALELIGNGANVIVANGGECKWSLALDSAEQLAELADFIGVTPR